MAPYVLLTCCLEKSNTDQLCFLCQTGIQEALTKLLVVDDLEEEDASGMYYCSDESGCSLASSNTVG